MEDLDTPNRNMEFEDYTSDVSIRMFDHTMHVYFDSCNGKHGFEIFYQNSTLKHLSDSIYYSLNQARNAGIEKLKLLGGYSTPLIKLVTSDSERKLA